MNNPLKYFTLTLLSYIIIREFKKYSLLYIIYGDFIISSINISCNVWLTLSFTKILFDDYKNNRIVLSELKSIRVYFNKFDIN